MKPFLMTLVVAMAMTFPTMIVAGESDAPAKDRTKYDCREVVGYKIVNHGQRPPLRRAIWECPHKDLMATGKCETHWLFGMRCKE